MSKRILSLILSIFIVFGCLSDLAYVHAKNIDVVVEAYEMQPYRNVSEKQEYALYPTKEGYVFSGWYQDEKCTTPVAKTTTTGVAYARFVDENVLSVKGQMRVNTSADSNDTDLRMVTTVDSLNYESVGFEMAIGDVVTEHVTDSVYTTINGYVDEKQETYKPEVFSSASNYFMAFKITGIPNSAFLTGINVSPKWTTLDGTTVIGIPKTFTINEVLGVETIILDNLSDRNNVYYTVDTSISAGQTIQFDVNVTSGQTVQVSVLGNGSWNQEYFSEEYTKSSIQKISVTVQVPEDIENYIIHIKFKDTSKDYAENVVTISNIQVLNTVLEDVTEETTETSYGTVWSASSTVKIRQDEIEYSDKGAAELKYEAVRNEYESRQLLITADKDISSFELIVSDLVSGNNVLPKEYVEVYVQKYIPVSSDDTYGASSTPDALLPMEAAAGYGENLISAGYNGGLWVTVYIPASISSGTYTGTFQLMLDGEEGKYTLDIPVSVEVHTYTLSDENTAKTLFSWRYNRVASGELDGSIEMMTKYYDYFEDYRISLQSLPLETLSGEEYAPLVQTYYDEITTYSILSHVGDIAGGLLYNPEKVKEQILAIASVSTEEKNLFDKAMIYFIDEPNLSDETARNTVISKITSLNALLQECVDEIEANVADYEAFTSINNWQQSILDIPNIIPLTGTAVNWLVTTEWSLTELEYITPDEQKKILEVINCICPNFENYVKNQERFETLREEYGFDIWWYGCVGPDSPAPTYHIGDSNLLSSRTVSWLQNKYNIGGNLYWDAAAYTDENSNYLNEYINVYENPYRNTASTWPAGDGFLTYPGEAYGVDGPIPSLRLMSIRDGMEEYELLCDVEEYLSVDMDSVFYDKIASCTTSSMVMYADGDSSLDFDVLRGTLLDYTDELQIDGNVSASDSPTVYDVVINQDKDLLTSIEKRINTELIFSFESYKDITETGIRMGNQLGETSINKNQNRITEGKASWQINPQGDYGDEDGYPYFRMRCTESTFTTSDFNAFDKILLDVYNASDEEMTIRWSFYVSNPDGETVETEATYCKLTPNAWTTCEFDLSDDAYSQYFYLDVVKYMKIQFMDKKDHKTDSVPELYLDNLRGEYSTTERVRSEYSYSLEEGVTFENAADRFVVFAGGGSSANNDFALSRVSYEDLGIKPAQGVSGVYALKGDATGSRWPTLTANFEQTYEAGSVLSFWMYVEVEEDATDGITYFMESSGNSFIYKNYRFNSWVRVNIKLGTDVDSIAMFVNFDDGAGGSKLGDAVVNIYMDDFRVYADEATLLETKYTVNEAGEVSITNPFNESYQRYAFDVSAYEGDTISFDIDVDPAREMSVWLYRDGVESSANEEYAKWYSNWSGKKTISVTAQADMENFMIRVLYRDLTAEKAGTTADFTERVLTISNINVKSNYDFYEGVTFEYGGHASSITKQDEAVSHQIDFSRVLYTEEELSVEEKLGSYGMKGVVGTSAKWPGFYINYGEEIPAGTGISFMMYVKVDNTNVTYSIGGKNVATNLDNVTKCNTTLPINQWFEIRLIQNDAVSRELIYLDLSSAYNAGLLSSGVTVYMDNFKLIENPQQTIDETTGDITVHTDWFKQTVTSSYAEVDYIWNVSLKQGDTITFTVDENGATGTGAFWAYFPVNGVYTEKAAASWTQTVKKTMTYTVTEDTETIRIRARYNNGVSAMKDFLIKNITIVEAIEDVTVTASELNGWVNGSHYRVEYIWNQALSKGDTITFTFDEGDTTASNGAVFVYKGIGGVYTQVAAKTWAQNRTQTYTATEDIDCIRLFIDYYDSDASAVADFAIKDIKVVTAD